MASEGHQGCPTANSTSQCDERSEGRADFYNDEVPGSSQLQKHGTPVSDIHQFARIVSHPIGLPDILSGDISLRSTLALNPDHGGAQEPDPDGAIVDN